MPRPRKNQKNKKKNNISELFLSHPKCQDLEKTKKKQKKKQYFRTLSEDTPKSKTPGFFFFLVFCRFLSRALKYCFFFLFFWFSAGFLVFFLRACPRTSRILLSLFLFGFLQGCFNFLSQGVPCWCSEGLLDQLNCQSMYEHTCSKSVFLPSSQHLGGQKTL